MLLFMSNPIKSFSFLGVTAQTDVQFRTIHDQADEILSHLMEKAKDVVKVALRSDPSLNVKQKPDVIFGVLCHYFSDFSLCLPLADFYATFPTRGESPVDYWIRLNKAAEVAIEGLCRQGQAAAPLTHEVACMFVKHCPDPELSYIFKGKPVSEWTARDM